MSSITIDTKFHGTCAIQEEQLLHFRYPMIGFERLRQFVLMPFDGERKIFVLQSVDEASVAFFLADPEQAFPTYAIPDGAVPKTFPGTAETRTLAVVLVPTKTGWTANLRAPILIDRATRIGGQIPLRDPLNFREPWPDEVPQIAARA